LPAARKQNARTRLPNALARQFTSAATLAALTGRFSYPLPCPVKLSAAKLSDVMEAT